MRPIVTAKTDPKPAARPLPADLANVALIDAPTCAAAGDMSVSWWHEEVRAGRAPAPVIRKPRCTRWRMADVRAFWIESAEKSARDTQAAEMVKAHATRASAKAKANRAAKVATVAAGDERAPS
jgi:predicted DNA-binding transcriptional regulator AlpA